MLKKIFKKKNTTRNTHGFPKNIEYSSLVKDVFYKLKNIQGWFNIDDCAHFYLILSYQNNMNICGDLLEIGSYFGRATSLMALMLKNEEKIQICDAFAHETQDTYKEIPTPKILIKNIKKIAPNISEKNIIIYNCLSNNLKLEKNQVFRFIHIDGGHSKEQVLFDLNLADKHLIKYGVISIDDYKHKNWPGVTIGTDLFLEKNKEKYSVLADLNRYGAYGRKLYIIKKSDN